MASAGGKTKRSKHTVDTHFVRLDKPRRLKAAAFKECTPYHKKASLWIFEDPAGKSGYASNA
jgi:hypothetical protein